VSGVISAVVEPNTLKAYLGGGLWPLLAAMAIGVPLYVCATASTPIALGLIHAGLSPGAALVFLISGPATNGAALTTLWKVLGRRPAIIYLVTVAVCAVGSGVLVDTMIDSGVVPLSAVVSASGSAPGTAPAPVHEHGQSLSAVEAWINHGSAVVLLLVLVVALRPSRALADEAASHPSRPDNADTLKVEVTGMRCTGCVQSLSRALLECEGVDGVDVDLGQRLAVVRGRGVVGHQIAEAVRSLGFEVANPDVLDLPGT
jgi:copper chaperone CopZ